MPLVNPSGEVDLSLKQAEAWTLLQDHTHREVFFGGGAGATKSSLGCFWKIMRRVMYPGTRGFTGRESFTALRDSTMKTYFEILFDLGYQSGRDYTFNAQEHTVYWSNGGEEHFRYMQYMPSDPDFNRFGSTEYTDGFVDEAPEVDSRACQVLLSRLRYRLTEYELIPKLLLTGNPGQHWVKEGYVMDLEGRLLQLPDHRACVLATIADHPDRAFADQYTQTLTYLDDYDRARLLYGDWMAKADVLRPFAFAFDKANPGRHIKVCELDIRQPVIVSIDFNLDPFCAIIAQEQGKRLAIPHEISIQGGTIEELAERVLTIAPHAFLHQYTGDSTGANRRIQMKSTASMWDDFLSAIRARDGQLRLPHNPTHKESREQCNYVFHHHPDIAIHPRCTGLIYDLGAVEVDEDMSIIKSDRSKSAQRADLLDTFRSLVNTYLRDWITTHRRINALHKHPERPRYIALPGGGREALDRLINTGRP